MLKSDLTKKRWYQVFFKALRLRLSKLQREKLTAQEIKIEGLQKNWDNIDRVMHQKIFSYVVKII